MMRRRNGPDGISPRHHNRTSSDFVSSAEKGSYDDAASKGRGLGGGKSVIRRVSNAVRSRLRQVTKIGRQQGLGKGVGFLAACLLLLWCGLQTPRLLGEGAGGGLMEHRGGSQASGVAEAVTSGVTGDQTEKGGVELGPRLAYGIMVYQRKGSTMEKTFGQFIRMFDALYDKENTYVVHVDIKSSQGLRYAISTFLDDRNNAYEVPSVSVSWGGITVVERTLALMQKALEVDDSWRFFVNLGHEDYPSVSQAEARRWMKDQPDGRNFIKCWPIEKHDFFGQTERHESRVTDVNVDDFLGMVKEYRSLGGNPGSQERLRTDYKFYKSLQQTMLSRQLTEFAATSSEARRLLLYMATSKAPDELYFPTLTQLDERFSSMATCDDTRHFSYWIRPGGSWHPEYLTLDHLPLVLNSTDFYIRKVSPDWSSGLLLDVLDMLRSGRPLDDALPIVKDWLNRDSEDGSKLGAPGGPIKEFTSDSVTEGIDELLRRQSEDAEAKRCIFMSYIMRRGAQVRMAQIVAANRAAEVSNEVERPRTGFNEEKKSRRPFAKRASFGDMLEEKSLAVE